MGRRNEYFPRFEARYLGVSKEVIERTVAFGFCVFFFKKKHTKGTGLRELGFSVS